LTPQKSNNHTSNIAMLNVYFVATNFYTLYGVWATLFIV
jgi:hypothetical protein